MCREALGLTAHQGTHCRGEPGTSERVQCTGDHDLRATGKRTGLSHSVVCQRSRGGWDSALWGDEFRGMLACCLPSTGSQLMQGHAGTA